MSTEPGIRLARLAMHTRFELVLVDDGDAANVRAAGEEALDEITRSEALLSAFQDGAELRHLNLFAGHTTVPLSPLLLRFLRQCCALVEATDGAFDPAIGALLDCWRIQGDGVDHPAPTTAAITAALEACDLRRQLLLDTEERHVRFAHPATRLDPGAIGKGWALDRAEAVLRDNGIHNALLHGGTSSVCGLGHAQEKNNWTIAIRHPTQPGSIIANAHLHDTSLSVSGQHGRTISAGGRRLGHILDPRSGRPVTDTLMSAVIHPSAMVSDALSTALLVLGVGGLALLAARFPNAHLLLIWQDGDTIRQRTLGSAFQPHSTPSENDPQATLPPGPVL